MARDRVSTGEMLRIRALVLNAGFRDLGRQSWTPDGLDTTFAVNYLGHRLLTLAVVGRPLWLGRVLFTRVLEDGL